jgi:hypothetical protein
MPFTKARLEIPSNAAAPEIVKRPAWVEMELDDYMKLEHLLVLAKAKSRLAQWNG